MRRRTMRDLGTLAGVIVIIFAIVLVNVFTRLDSLGEQAAKMRMAVEAKWRNEGYEVLEWELLKETTGRFLSGPTFPEGLADLDGKAVNLVGFMTPIDQFTNVSEFMLLPVPITCYFCSSPPMRHIIEVKLTEPTPELVNEPVIIGGQLILHEKKGSTFFYTIQHALFNEAIDTRKAQFTELEMDAEHKEHALAGWTRDEQGQAIPKSRVEEELEPGQEPPAPASAPSRTHTGVPVIEEGPMNPGQEPPSASGE